MSREYTQKSLIMLLSHMTLEAQMSPVVMQGSRKAAVIKRMPLLCTTIQKTKNYVATHRRQSRDLENVWKSAPEF